MAPADIAAASMRRIAPVLARLTGGRKAVSGHARLIARPTYQRFLAAEPLLRRLIPILIIIFLAIVAAARYVQLTDMRDDRDTFAREQLSMVTALVATSMRQTIPNADGDAATPQPQQLLDDALASSVLIGDRFAYLTNTNGVIVAASDNDRDAIGLYLTDVVHQVQPLLAFGANAGSIDVSLTGNQAALAAGRLVDGVGSPHPRRIDGAA